MLCADDGHRIFFYGLFHNILMENLNALNNKYIKIEIKYIIEFNRETKDIKMHK